jgi:hypothetical protein
MYQSMKKKSLIISLLFMAITSIAQEVTKEDVAKLQVEADKLKTMKPDTVKPWKLGGVVALNGQQVSLRSTWDNSLALG